VRRGDPAQDQLDLRGLLARADVRLPEPEQELEQDGRVGLPLGRRGRHGAQCTCGPRRHRSPRTIRFEADEEVAVPASPRRGLPALLRTTRAAVTGLVFALAACGPGEPPPAPEVRPVRALTVEALP